MLVFTPQWSWSPLPWLLGDVPRYTHITFLSRRMDHVVVIYIREPQIRIPTISNLYIGRQVACFSCFFIVFLCLGFFFGGGYALLGSSYIGWQHEGTLQELSLAVTFTKLL